MSSSLRSASTKPISSPRGDHSDELSRAGDPMFVVSAVSVRSPAPSAPIATSALPRTNASSLPSGDLYGADSEWR
jgi:hypothetical protein